MSKFIDNLTIEQKAKLYSQGVRVITVDGDLDSDNLSDMQRFAQFVYPVGSIVELTVATNPATLWGIGTWESFMPGRVLVGAGTADSGTVYEAGAVGGEEKHTLTTDEMPSHSHSVSYASTDATDQSWGYSYTHDGGKKSAASPASSGIYPNGSSQPHNIMQPYGVVYRWLRTA